MCSNNITNTGLTFKECYFAEEKSVEEGAAGDGGDGDGSEVQEGLGVGHGGGAGCHQHTCHEYGPLKQNSVRRG